MSDNISRQEAMAYPLSWEHYDKEHGDRKFICGVESYREYIEHLPSVDEWTPCSERLPEMLYDKLIGDFSNSGPCVVTYEKHGCRWTAEITFTYCSDGLWRWCPNWEDEVFIPIDTDCSIVAWMPLPEPYKGGAV